MRKSYRNSVPVQFDFTLDQFNPDHAQAMGQQFYYHHNSFGHYQPQVINNKYAEGIFIGKLAFTIKNESVEEDAYTGTGALKTKSRQAKDRKGGNNLEHNSKRKQFNHTGLNDDNFITPELQNVNQSAAQPLKKEEIVALEFLLGSQNPLVMRSHQHQQQQHSKPQHTSGPVKKVVPLLENVINFGSNPKPKSVNSIANNSENNLPLDFILDKMHAPGSKNSLSEQPSWHTPEKRNSLNDLSDPSEKVNELELSTASSDSVTKSDIRSLNEELSTRKYPGRAQKKLRFKSQNCQDDENNSWAILDEQKLPSSKEKNSRNALINFEIDNIDLFPPLL